MAVFKAYFKIIKQNLIGTIIYFAVFLLISILASSTSPKAKLEQNFQETSVRIAMINNDDSTILTQAIEDLLGRNNTFVEVDASKEAIKEALFFRNIEYAIVIPKNFTASYIKKEPLEIISYRVPDSYSSVYLDMTVNQFLNDLRLYEQFSTKGFQQNIDAALRNMNNQTEVKIESKDFASQSIGLDFYAHYSSYIIISAILYCVTTFMILFNHSLVRQRTDCSPVKPIFVESQIVLANILLGLIAIVILSIPAMIMYRGDVFTTKSLLYFGLMFVYCLMCIALAFLISNFTNEKSILNAIVTTLSLVFAFLGGTFVPLSMLGENVRIIGSFVPAYWFSIACEHLTNTSNYAFSNLMPYLQSLGIIFLFGVAFLAIGLLLRKTRRFKFSS